MHGRGSHTSPSERFWALRLWFDDGFQDEGVVDRSEFLSIHGSRAPVGYWAENTISVVCQFCKLCPTVTWAEPPLTPTPALVFIPSVHVRRLRPEASMICQMSCSFFAMFTSWIFLLARLVSDVPLGWSWRVVVFLVPCLVTHGSLRFLCPTLSRHQPMRMRYFTVYVNIVNPNNPVNRNRLADLFLSVGLKLRLHVVPTCLRVQVVLVRVR